MARWNAKLALVAVLGIVFFFVIGYLEWNYYLVESSKGLVDRIVKTDGILRKGMPRKFANVVLSSEKSENRPVSRHGSLHQGHLNWGVFNISTAALPSSPAIVLFCYDRVAYLNKTLASLAELPGLEEIDVYISQDGNHRGVASLIDKTMQINLRANAKHVEHWQHDRQPLLSLQQVCPCD
jgi:hypothetical protein